MEGIVDEKEEVVGIVEGIVDEKDEMEGIVDEKEEVEGIVDEVDGIVDEVDGIVESSFIIPAATGCSFIGNATTIGPSTCSFTGPATCFVSSIIFLVSDSKFLICFSVVSKILDSTIASNNLTPFT